MNVTELKNNLPHWEKQIYACSTYKELEQFKVDILGKSGIITSAFKMLAGIDVDEKREVGIILNNIKSILEISLKKQMKKLDDYEILQKLQNETVDITIPSSCEYFGQKHMISNSISRIKKYFNAIGFEVADGPEIEDDFHNFTALNIPEHHPARQSHDSFYIKDMSEKLLRTHTSGMQIRYMTENPLPIRMISVGRVFRNDDLDATHSPVFHQVEGLVVDKIPISIGHLKKTLSDFIAFFFELNNAEIRFRPSFFPFTEPGMEVDCKYNKNGQMKWLELGGAGMVHPNVYKACGIEDNVYGFAFGFGIDRLTMLKNDIHDIRNIFSTDQRWLTCS